MSIGSGNCLEDALDEELNERKRLDCGCVGRCTCDENEE
jgi:hypothetical protein